MATEFIIKDEDLTGLKDKVVIVTGGSSGIGLATVKLLLELGAKVVNADVQDSECGYFIKTDVTSWSDLTNLFKKTKEKYGRIDDVFANAGMSPVANYLATDVNKNGDLKEPSHTLLDVSLKGVMNTCTLAMYYMRPEQQPGGGSIVINGSTTGFQPLSAVDYSTAKHGVLGFGRGLHQILGASGLPIRVNTLTPTWTETNVLPNMKGLFEELRVQLQPPRAVAKAAILLMADASRNGQVIWSGCEKYKEIDEAVLLPAAKSINGDNVMEEDVFKRALQILAAAAASKDV